METVFDLPLMSTTNGQLNGRIDWIDDIKVVAGMLMILDHGLLYFGLADSWPRYTITRCVEPLYVFAFGYLIALRPRFSRKRWSQIVLAATLETALHSFRVGYLYFGILANLVVVIPFAPWLAKQSSQNLARMVIATAILSVLPLRGGGVVIDYGPPLLIGQVAFAAWVARGSRRCLRLLFWSWIASLGAAVGLLLLTSHVGPTFWTSTAGHPIAAVVIWALRSRQLSKRVRRSLHWLAKSPLTFYIGHLLVLHSVARILRG